MNIEQSQFSLWREIGFLAEETQDGSPTLRILSESQFAEVRPESMHHSGGAYSESVYIYGQIIDEAMKKLRSQNDSVNILSLGLGLGYNELLTSVYAIKNGLGKKYQLTSYEIVPDLVKGFLSYCRRQKLPEEISKTYDQIIKFYEKNFQLSAPEILYELERAFQEGRWSIEQDFFQASRESNNHVLLYDAFSGKTNQNLWTEEFLTEKINLCSAEDAIFGTYACRASLKRALKNCGFEVIVRDGFLGKRNSTQGRRGLFKSDLRNDLHIR